MVHVKARTDSLGNCPQWRYRVAQRLRYREPRHQTENSLSLFSSVSLALSLSFNRFFSFVFLYNVCCSWDLRTSDKTCRMRFATVIRSSATDRFSDKLLELLFRQNSGPINGGWKALDSTNPSGFRASRSPSLFLFFSLSHYPMVLSFQTTSGTRVNRFGDDFTRDSLVRAILTQKIHLDVTKFRSFWISICIFKLIPSTELKIFHFYRSNSTIVDEMLWILTATKNKRKKVFSIRVQ